MQHIRMRVCIYVRIYQSNIHYGMKRKNYVSYLALMYFEVTQTLCCKVTQNFRLC